MVDTDGDGYIDVDEMDNLAIDALRLVKPVVSFSSTLIRIQTHLIIAMLQMEEQQRRMRNSGSDRSEVERHKKVAAAIEKYGRCLLRS